MIWVPVSDLLFTSSILESLSLYLLQPSMVHCFSGLHIHTCTACMGCLYLRGTKKKKKIDTRYCFFLLFILFLHDVA